MTNNGDVFQSTKRFGLRSVYPCTRYLTFGPWIYLVPQFKPDSVLILGYAGGTVAGLIRLFYGNAVTITGVDINKPEDLYYDVNLIRADAQKYIKTCDYHEVIVVDLYDECSFPCSFVTTEEFVRDVSAKCNYLIVHAEVSTDMRVYECLNQVKVLSLNQKRFYYFTIGRCSKLPIR